MERSIDIDRKEENSEIKNAISKLLEPYSFGVLYSPLRTEVSPGMILSIDSEVEVYAIAPRASLDPAEEAANALERARERAAFILIPGRRFDTTGTRHGQGGGWYDRFLSYVPASWLRIGFCFSNEFSLESLPRQPWDQIMDYVCVVDRVQNVEHVTLHKTNGRGHDIPIIIA